MHLNDSGGDLVGDVTMETELLIIGDNAELINAGQQQAVARDSHGNQTRFKGKYPIPFITSSSFIPIQCSINILACAL